LLKQTPNYKNEISENSICFQYPSWSQLYTDIHIETLLLQGNTTGPDSLNQYIDTLTEHLGLFALTNENTIFCFPAFENSLEFQTQKRVPFVFLVLELDELKTTVSKYGFITHYVEWQ